jgi:hypothetical protein
VAGARAGRDASVEVTGARGGRVECARGPRDVKSMVDPSPCNVGEIAASELDGDLQLAVVLYSDVMRCVRVLRALGKDDDVAPWDYGANQVANTFMKFGVACELVG